MNEQDLDYLFEVELENHIPDIQECIEHVKKLHDRAVPRTKAKDIFFAMATVLETLDIAIHEVQRTRLEYKQLHIRQQICEMLLKRLLSYKNDDTLDKIIQRAIDDIGIKPEEKPPS